MTSDGAEDNSEVCQQCGDRIDDGPLYPIRDIRPGDGGLTYVEDPDGPFCGVGCRRDFDAE